jgi:hypothetical protein
LLAHLDADAATAPALEAVFDRAAAEQHATQFRRIFMRRLVEQR